MNNQPRLSPLGIGSVFLIVSLVLASILPHASDQEGTILLGWLENTAFWIGIVCVAGSVFSTLLRYRDNDRTPGI